jgi:hypothetical protein
MIDNSRLAKALMDGFLAEGHWPYARVSHSWVHRSLGIYDTYEMA